jgi:hypothetical protein
LKRGWFFKVRVALLLSVLAIVVLYALKDVWRRRQRSDWTRELGVALVIAHQGPVDRAALDALRAEVPKLQDRLNQEFRRYRGTGRPFSFVVYGPVPASVEPPKLVADGLLALAQHAWALRRFVGALDERADVPSAGFDSRLYLVVRAPKSQSRLFVEGMSEQGGRVGIAEAELDPTMPGFVLFVAAHELFHTLGATDKYDERGLASVPAGLAEPELTPLYPQRYAEVMARNRPIAPGVEQPPVSIDELSVGAVTAAEVGWK